MLGKRSASAWPASDPISTRNPSLISVSANRDRRSTPRAGLHRRAEAGRRRLRAVNCDEQGGFPSLFIDRNPRTSRAKKLGPEPRLQRARRLGRREMQSGGSSVGVRNPSRVPTIGRGHLRNGGNKNRFQECGPTTKPKYLSSSRRWSRYVPASCRSVHPCGRSRIEPISS